jgi:hypothetical protein
MRFVFLKAGVVLSCLAACTAPVHAGDITCATGFVTVVEYGAYDVNGHSPYLKATVNGTSVFIGMNANDPKDRAEISDMRAMLQSAMLGHVSASVVRKDGKACTNDKGQTQNQMAILLQTQ